jgi:hypothetical protein
VRASGEHHVTGDGQLRTWERLGSGVFSYHQIMSNWFFGCGLDADPLGSDSEHGLAP